VKNSPTYRRTEDFLLGDLQPSQVVKIPPGIAHGCRTVQGPVNLFYVTFHVYDPDDESRIPHDDEAIRYDWLKGADHHLRRGARRWGRPLITGKRE